jgi:hypothetical protein
MTRRMTSYDVSRVSKLTGLLKDRLSDDERISVVRNEDNSIEIFKRGNRVVRITPFLWLRFYAGQYVDEKGWIKSNDKAAERIARFV